MSRRWIWAQLAIGYAILELALWTSGGTQAAISWVVAAWFIISVAVQGRSPREIGLAASGFQRGLIALPFALAGSLIFVSLAWAAGSLRLLHGTSPVWAHVLGYSAWALFQQFMLQSFFYVSLEELLGRGRKSLLLAAALFAIAHVPNPVLVPATFVGALFFISVFRYSKNIYPLGVAHALLGLSLAISAPQEILRNMRVGAGYFRYEVSREARWNNYNDEVRDSASADACKRGIACWALHTQHASRGGDAF